MKYCLLILTIFYFVIKWGSQKELTPYNVKFKFAYIVYLLWMVAKYDLIAFDDSDPYLDVKEFIWRVCLFPLLLYLLLPVLLKYIGNWEVIKGLDKVIDKWYLIIKERF